MYIQKVEVFSWGMYRKHGNANNWVGKRAGSINDNNESLYFAVVERVLKSVFKYEFFSLWKYYSINWIILSKTTGIEIIIK